MTISNEKTFGRSGLRLDQIDQLTATLDELNGRSTTYTASYRDLVAVAKSAESELARINLPESSRRGATAVYTTGGGTKYSKWSNAAKGSYATLKRFQDGWRIMSLASTTVYGGQSTRVKVAISQEQREIAERKTFEDFEVRSAA